MSDPAKDPGIGSGRRSATGRPGLHPTALLALLLPALTVGALLLVRPAEVSDPPRPPDETTLDSAAVGCPTADARATGVAVATGQESASGDVRLFTAKAERSVRVEPGRVTRVDGPGPVVLTATGELAPGLLAARTGDRQTAAVSCPAPTPETWFTGVGAAARRGSVLELVNPDGGPAVADISVYGPRGPLTADSLRGITVSGRDSKRVDLGEALPRRGDLTLRVVVSRGRLAATVLDQLLPIGSSPEASDWLPGQPEATERQLLLGLPPGGGRDTLVVTNPGDDEARVAVKILTRDAVFAPAGLEETRVPPGSVRTVNVTDAVRREIRDGAIGLEITSTEPVTSTLRSVVGGDLSFAAPVQPSDVATTALVPTGEATVQLADADGVGVATVTAWSEAGKELVSKRVELKDGTGGSVDLPRGAALVRVAPSRTSVHAAVLVTGDGATVVPLRAAVTRALVPDVRPGLP